MGNDRLIEQLLALPLPDRVNLAEVLWESIDEGSKTDGSDVELQAIGTAKLRDAQLESGAVTGRSHDQVMEAARRSLGCE